MSLIVSDASPLIALQQIERLDLLETIFGSLVIPPAVAREAANVPLGDWIAIRSLQGPLPPLVTRAGLGPGESESIGVALEAGADRVILDDRPARRLAEALGIPVIGTLGILLAAKRKGLITAVRQPVDALREDGFRVANDIYEEILQRAGEKT